MERFNIEKAKAGAKICTRDGSSVRIICYDRKSSYGECIVTLIQNKYDSENEALAMYYANGKASTRSSSVMDLFIKD